MNLMITKTLTITNEDEWFRAAPPVKIGQWKNGRSAKLLAQYATSDTFINDINLLLKDNDIKITKSAMAEPEAITSLPKKGKGREHDLLISDIGEDGFVIGIEAKVSELFGETIGEEYNKVSGNKKDRIDELLKYLNVGYGIVKDCRYQLLTGYVGTLLEAKQKEVNKCVFLIIVFKGDVEIPQNQINNYTDNNSAYSKFCGALNISEGELKEYTIENFQIKCAIRKMEVDITKTRFS